LKLVLLVTELGLLLLDEKGQAVSKFQFLPQERTRRYVDASSGTLAEGEVGWVKQNVSEDDVVACTAELGPLLSAAGIKAEQVSPVEASEFNKKRLDAMVSSGLASNVEEAQSAVRDVSLEASSLKIKELSSNPDLQAMESVQALDEIDKTANIMSARVREWYGLHFPELTSWIDDNPSLMKLVLKFRTRENYNADELESMGYSKNKSRAIADASKESRGADMREEDLLRVTQLAEEALHLFALREKLAAHVEKTMKQVAPNLSEIAGPSIGARLIAKAGGLQKLAILPASTIQILGAEKALYRALKSGARPPKHGILFQHEAVHSAPKWQRGKIARSVAGKIAIAARIDTYRGSKDEKIAGSLQARLDEIKEKYKEAPKEEEIRRRVPREERGPPRFRPGMPQRGRGPREERERRGGGRGKYRKERRGGERQHR